MRREGGIPIKIVVFTASLFQGLQKKLLIYLRGRAGGGGLRSGSAKSYCQKLREIAGKKLRCRNQTSRSLNEQHLCTGDTRGTNTHARGTGKKQLWKIAGDCEIAKNCAPNAPCFPSDNKFDGCPPHTTISLPAVLPFIVTGALSQYLIGCLSLWRGPSHTAYARGWGQVRGLEQICALKYWPLMAGPRDVLERLTTVGGRGVPSGPPPPSLDPDFIVGNNEICKRKY